MLKSISGIELESARTKRRMNTAEVPGTAWRGRVLLSASLNDNVPVPRAVQRGRKVIKPVRPDALQTIGFRLRAIILEGNNLPDAKDGVFTKDLWVQVSCGQFVMETKKSDPDNGICKWYENLEVEAAFPPDLSQVPDIFVDLMVGDRRVSHRRFTNYAGRVHTTAGPVSTLRRQLQIPCFSMFLAQYSRSW